LTGRMLSKNYPFHFECKKDIEAGAIQCLHQTERPLLGLYAELQRMFALRVKSLC
jgi:hypothetical protein